MKLVVILVLALLVLGGGGGAAYFFFFAPSEDAAEAEPPPPPPPASHSLGSLRVPVIQGGTVVRYIQLDLAARLKKPSLEAGAERATLERFKPRLRDAMLRELIAFFQFQPHGGAVPLTAIEDRLTHLVNRHVGEALVERVVVESATEADTETR